MDYLHLKTHSVNGMKALERWREQFEEAYSEGLPDLSLVPLLEGWVNLNYINDAIETLSSFVNGSSPILEQSYRKIEFASPLFLLNAIQRSGVRNELNGSIQQSYAHHIRILMRGLDALRLRDKSWFKCRYVGSEEIDPALEELFLFSSLFRDIDLLIGIFIGAAFHDVGKLLGARYDLDARPGILLVEKLLRNQSRTVAAVAKFIIEKHDEIEHVLTGESPKESILDHEACALYDLQSQLIPILTFIQIAGEASLGEGRLSDERIQRVFPLLRDYSNVIPTDARRIQLLLGGDVKFVSQERELLKRVRFHRWGNLTKGFSFGRRSALISDILRHLKSTGIRKCDVVLVDSGARRQISSEPFGHVIVWPV